MRGAVVRSKSARVELVGIIVRSYLLIELAKCTHGKRGSTSFEILLSYRRN